MSGFAKRVIELDFRLMNGAFEASNNQNTVTLSGLRTYVTVRNPGGSATPSADIRIFGLSLSLANTLSTLGKFQTEAKANTVTIRAGEAGGTLPVVFVGSIAGAWVDAASPPDVALVVSAYAGYLEAMRPLPATSYRGAVPAATVIAGIAAQMGYTFENAGVTAVLSNPYFPGTGMQQARKCAEHAHCHLAIEEGTRLVIWPLDGTRSGQIPLVSPDTGMMASPIYTQNGLMVNCAYNPNIRIGGRIKISSMLKPACGTWSVSGIEHELEAETPGGSWMTRVTCLTYSIGGAHSD